MVREIIGDCPSFGGDMHSKPAKARVTITVEII